MYQKKFKFKLGTVSYPLTTHAITMFQVNQEEEGETIGMTTNTDVKTYKSVDEVNGRVSINNGAELRKRKESLGKRQDSFIRPLEERPLTKEDLRRSFGSKQSSVDPENRKSLGSKQNSVDPENVTLEEKSGAAAQVSEI